MHVRDTPWRIGFEPAHLFKPSGSGWRTVPTMSPRKPSVFSQLFLCSVFATCTTNAVAAEPAVAHDFGWLSGHWCLEQGGELVEETWLVPRGDLMLGIGRTFGAGKVSFEFLRIELRAGVPHYVAQPGGAPPTAFLLTASGKGWARFENPQHDFPKRVEYRRTARGLHAEIAGPGEGGRENVIPFDYLPCGST
jgi:hypothetical protein